MAGWSRTLLVGAHQVLYISSWCGGGAILPVGYVLSGMDVKGLGKDRFTLAKDT